MLTCRSGSAAGPIGQGTWRFGEEPAYAREEIESLQTGIDRGMKLIDTAEMYGSGGAEVIVGEAIRGMDRENLYLVSKIYPHNCNWRNYLASCEDSLHRLGTDYLDLYLLHWRGATSLLEVVACMEDLKKKGLIRDWGVSNFDIGDMEQLWTVPEGPNCRTNQVLYQLGSRGIEYSLLPWMQDRGILTMAYCPLAQAGALTRGLFENECLKAVARKHKATPAQILLAFLLTRPLVLPIPRTRLVQHVMDNAEAAEIQLSQEDLAALDRAFPAPRRKLPLDVE